MERLGPRSRRQEWSLLAAALLASVAAFVAPAAVFAAFAVAIWAAIVLARSRGRRKRFAPLAAIAVVAVAMTIHAAISVVTYLAESGDQSAVTLIEG